VVPSSIVLDRVPGLHRKERFANKKISFLIHCVVDIDTNKHFVREPFEHGVWIAVRRSCGMLC